MYRYQVTTFYPGVSENPDQPIPAASTGILLTGETESQLEIFSGSASSVFMEFGSLLWILVLLPAAIFWSRAMKGTKRARRIGFALPGAVSAISTGVIILGFYPDRFLCLAIQCTGSISFLANLNVYLLTVFPVWAIAFLAGRLSREKLIWIPLFVFESTTAPALVLSAIFLNTMHQLWVNSFYYDWMLALPSYAVLVSIAPVQFFSTRLSRQNFSKQDCTKLSPPKPQTFLDL